MGLAFLSGAKRNRSLLFFLEEKKQKKINCGTVILCRSSRFHQPVTQNGRFVCEPSVFSFHTGRAGKRLFSEKHPPPQCLLFLFFKKRNRSLSFLSRKKRKQKKVICRSCFCAFQSGLCDPVTQNGRFTYEPSVFRSWQNVRESVFSQINHLSRSVFCFFSSRKENVPFQEKKSYPLEEKERGERRPQPAGMGSGSGAGIAVCESFVPRSIVGTFTRQPFG